ncbi:MAG: cupin domain-containing protein [Clostridiales bacterium]|nr:cupin domain-containing protein [Clostridiales bacterium]
MKDIFPLPVLNLPEADIPVKGATAYLSQGERHQILFMRFAQDAVIPEHAHAGQWGVVLEGKIELAIGDEKHVFGKGDRYYIPAGVRHSARIFAGYADITYFDQADRYAAKRQGKPASARNDSK